MRLRCSRANVDTLARSEPRLASSESPNAPTALATPPTAGPPLLHKSDDLFSHLLSIELRRRQSHDTVRLVESDDTFEGATRTGPALARLALQR